MLWPRFQSPLYFYSYDRLDMYKTLVSPYGSKVIILVPKERSFHKENTYIRNPHQYPFKSYGKSQVFANRQTLYKKFGPESPITGAWKLQENLN